MLASVFHYELQKMVELDAMNLKICQIWIV